ncbi:MAG: hypothetical protein HOA79_05545 [Acidiferrobacteraceae bacterium]|nr:hypothetical protein [Acidiferrobacteraceae bacterium]
MATQHACLAHQLTTADPTLLRPHLVIEYLNCVLRYVFRDKKNDCVPGLCRSALHHLSGLIGRGD